MFSAGRVMQPAMVIRRAPATRPCALASSAFKAARLGPFFRRCGVVDAVSRTDQAVLLRQQALFLLAQLRPGLRASLPTPCFGERSVTITRHGGQRAVLFP